LKECEERRGSEIDWSRSKDWKSAEFTNPAMKYEVAKRAKPATLPTAKASMSALPPMDSIPLRRPRRSATVLMSAAPTPRSPASPKMEANAIAEAQIPKPPTPKYNTRKGFRIVPATKATRVEARVQLVPTNSLRRSALMESEP